MELSQVQNVNALIRTGTSSDVASSGEQAVQQAVREQTSVFDAQPAYQLNLSEAARELLATNPPRDVSSSSSSSSS
ncbi:hypothetical protein [Kiloniella sp. b19]|uniref:hypothetical protein n=1 Tax=Kiloniella sp. GXU_MW_B19 TaxID=3141326 RepID=UPI0031D11ACD